MPVDVLLGDGLGAPLDQQCQEVERLPRQVNRLGPAEDLSCSDVHPHVVEPKLRHSKSQEIIRIVQGPAAPYPHIVRSRTAHTRRQLWTGKCGGCARRSSRSSRWDLPAMPGPRTKCSPRTSAS